MASAPGIRVRHSRKCTTSTLTPEQRRDAKLVARTCNCTPTYEAWIYSKRDDKKIRESFATLAEARGWRTDTAKQVRDRKLRAPTGRTLRQEVDEWLAGVREGRILNKRERPYKPGVIRNYELSLRLRVLPELGDRKLASIDLADLLDLKEQLSGDGVSASTLRNSFVPLQAIYRRAHQRGLVSVNPTTDLSLPIAGSRDRAATPAEAVELLAALNPPERALWATALYAGLRRGELRALRARDIDLEAKTISVQRGWDDKEGPIEPKSVAGTRTVFLANALRPHLDVLTARLEGDPEGLAFGLTAETAFEPKNIGRKATAAWKAKNDRRIAEAAERDDKDDPQLLDPITLHEARHSFSTFCDHAGISESRADRYMGHSTGSVSGRYRHLLPGQIAEDRQIFDRYLTGVVAGKVVPLSAAG